MVLVFLGDRLRGGSGVGTGLWWYLLACNALVTLLLGFYLEGNLSGLLGVLSCLLSSSNIIDSVLGATGISGAGFGGVTDISEGFHFLAERVSILVFYCRIVSH